MPFSIDFLDDGRILEWEATADGTVATERDDYTPCFYVGARDPETDLDLTTLQSVYDQHPDVVATEMVTQRPGFRRDEEAVLAVDVAHIDRVTPLARQARQLSAYPVGDPPVSTSTSRESSGTVWRPAPIRRRRASCRHCGSASQ